VLLLLFIETADAHPHMWVTLKSDIIFATDGSLSAVRYAWSFDEMTSAFVTLSIKTQQKGVFTREELAPLAQANVLLLKGSDYFTKVKVNGIKHQFDLPIDYWLEFDEGILTLHFTIPFKSPVQTQTLDLEVYDPSYFVDISFSEKAPVVLVDAPSGCELLVTRQSWAQTANKIIITCPSLPVPIGAN